MRTAIALYFLFTSQAIALDCNPLEPSADDTVSREFQGMIDGKVDSSMTRLGGVNAKIDGSFKEIIRAPDLSNMSRGEQLYIWEKLIFLKCEILRNSQLSDSEKNKEFNELFEKMLIGPNQTAEASNSQLEAYNERVRLLADSIVFGSSASQSRIARQRSPGSLNIQKEECKRIGRQVQKIAEPIPSISDDLEPAAFEQVYKEVLNEQFYKSSTLLSLRSEALKLKCYN